MLIYIYIYKILRLAALRLAILALLPEMYIHMEGYPEKEEEPFRKSVFPRSSRSLARQETVGV